MEFEFRNYREIQLVFELKLFLFNPFNELLFHQIL